MITSSSDIVAKQPNKRAICSLMCYYYWGLGYYRFSKLFPHWIGHYGRPLVIDIFSIVVILR